MRQRQLLGPQTVLPTRWRFVSCPDISEFILVGSKITSAFSGQQAASTPLLGGHGQPAQGRSGRTSLSPHSTRAPGQRPACGTAGPGPTADAGPVLEPVPGPEWPPPAGPRGREASWIFRPRGIPATEAADGVRSAGSLTKAHAPRRQNAKQTGPPGPDRLSPAPSRGFCTGTRESQGSTGLRAHVSTRS